jgi:hypothetical protein
MLGNGRKRSHSLLLGNTMQILKTIETEFGAVTEAHYARGMARFDAIQANGFFGAAEFDLKEGDEDASKAVLQGALDRATGVKKESDRRLACAESRYKKLKRAFKKTYGEEGKTMLKTHRKAVADLITKRD